MILDTLKARFASEVLDSHQERGDLTVILRKDQCHEVFKFLKEDPELNFNGLMDICGVDYLPMGLKPRFEVVYHLYSTDQNHRLRVRIKIPEKDMKLPTITDLWASANWSERETFDMFGVVFEGHPHLKRLLMFEGFAGHPLRKDYPIAKRQKIPVPEERP